MRRGFAVDLESAVALLLATEKAFCEQRTLGITMLDRDILPN